MADPGSSLPTEPFLCVKKDCVVAIVVSSVMP